ncbi:MAG: hypothetical protein ABI367_02210 [Mucilaginibacter sp.]
MNLRIKLNSYTLLVVIYLLALVLFNSCKQKPKQESPPKSSVATQQFKTTAQEDSINLFAIIKDAIKEGDTIAFVSISDIDKLPGNLNSPIDSVNRLVFPSFEGKTVEEKQRVTLTGQFRKRLLNNAKILENDSLYVYDYADDKLLTFPISSLDAVAYLNTNGDDSEYTHGASDYQFGFKLNHIVLKKINDDYYNKTYVYIGARNPFTKGQMHAVIWQTTNNKNMPFVALKKEETKILKGHKLTATYTFKFEDLNFFLQVYELKKEQEPAHRLLIFNSKNEVVYNALYNETEYGGVLPISLVDNKNYKNYYEQWVGRLLKDRPTLIFGFENNDADCDLLSYIDSSKGYIRLKCDNRF